MTPARPLIGVRPAGAATATFSLVRVTISMILRSLRLSSRISHGVGRAVAPVLVVLHKSLVCKSGQAAGWRTVKSHVFGRQL